MDYENCDIVIEKELDYIESYHARLAENSRKTFDRKANFVREYKDRPCVDCGKSYPYYVMDFDHRDPTLKVFSIGHDGAKFSYKKLKEEIEKCDVVCANCHRERTHSKGQTPLFGL
jgi:hypothetical protein